MGPGYFLTRYTLVEIHSEIHNFQQPPKRRSRVVLIAVSLLLAARSGLKNFSPSWSLRAGGRRCTYFNVNFHNKEKTIIKACISEKWGEVGQSHWIHTHEILSEELLVVCYKFIHRGVCLQLQLQHSSR